MYAIVEMAGQQFKVAKDQRVFVHRLEGNEGDTVTFDKVLLLDNGTVTIGAPAIDGAAVVAKILGHQKGDKVIVFKKKRRKGFRKKNGHRQSFTQILVESIVTSGFKAEKPKTEVKAAVEKKVEVVKEETLKSTPKAPKAETKKSVQADDLKLVEGIGPKIAEIFVEAGIDTFAKLADSKVEKLQEILTAAGARYASKNPSSWPKQAKMAADGKWDELKVWQENAKGGIE